MATMLDLQGTKWTGTHELWLDPLGDEVIRSDCNVRIEADVVLYTWSYEGKAHEGSLTLCSDGVDYVDTWHQPEPMKCRRLRDARGIFQAQGSYGPDSDWAWRSALYLRAPTGELVVQMTNITPWGEESRAVRIVCARDV